MTTDYRPDIDGLRAVAVTAVIIFHAFPGALPGGFVGVDIFFVISGYLITKIITRELDNETFSLRRFYERRIRRIFPALIVVLCATLFFGVQLLLQPELRSLEKHIIGSVFFSTNLLLLSEVNYFDLAARMKPLLHLWSLGIEEQFYLLWPLALLLAQPRYRMPLIFVVIVGSFALNIGLVGGHPSAAFYLPFTRAWELMAGAAFAGIGPLPKAFRQISPLIGAALICTALLTLTETTVFPGWAAALPVTGASLLIASGGSVVNRLLAFRPFVGLGLVSYPLYLWHWPVLVFMQIRSLAPLSTTERTAAIVVSLVLAIATYLLVERPFRVKGVRLVRPLLGGMALAGLGAATCWAVYTPTYPPEISRYIHLPGAGGGWRVHQCMLLDADDQFASDCSDKKRPLIAVWGDSTAAALTPGLRHAQKQRNFGLAQFTVSSCPPLLVNVHSMSELCIERNKKIVDLIGSISPQTVILHAIWDNNDTVESTRPTIDALRAKGVKNIVILGPVPVWPGGITNAYATYYRRTGALLPERTSLFVAPTSADERMSEIANILDVRYISARSALCNDSGCLTRIGTEPLVADALHLTEAGSNILADAVVSKLSALARIETQE